MLSTSCCVLAKEPAPRAQRRVRPASADRPLTRRRPSLSAGGALLVRLQRAVPVARVHVHRPHLDAVAPRVPHDLRRRVEAHRLAVEQRRGERRRVVALEPGRDVHQQREARRVGLGEAVLAEARDLLEDPLGELVADSRVRACPRSASAAKLLDARRGRFQAAIARRSWSASPGVKPAATIASCITCSWKSGTPSVFSQHAAHRVGGIRRPAPRRCGAAGTGAPCRPGSARAARSRPRSPGRRTARPAVAAASTSARGFDLEHADRVGAADHVVDRRVLGAARSASVQRRGRDAASIRSKHLRIAVSMPRPRHVDLEDAQIVEVVLVPLDDGAVRHGRVLDRHQLAQRPAGEDEAADVLRRGAAGSRGAAPPARAAAGMARLQGRARPRAAGSVIDVGWPSHQCIDCARRSTRSDDRPSALPTSRTAERGR